MRAASSRNEIRDAAVFVTLVVVDMSRENHDAVTGAALAFLQNFCQCLFSRASRVPTAHHFHVGGTGIGRMMIHDKDKIYVGGNVIELVGEPLVLRPRRFFLRAVKDKEERIGGVYGVVAAVL